VRNSNLSAAVVQPVAGRRLDEHTSAALEILENRWTLRLLAVLVGGPARFSELEAAVPGVSRRMMTERLRELEGVGLVRRTVDPGPPIRSTYALTSEDDELETILGLMRDWAASRHLQVAS
jgi:DNA-binding HxlR family transcriptional regulator